MNPLKLSLTTVLTSVLFLLGSVTHAQEVILRDFTKKNFDYGYEGWKEMASVVEKSATSVHIQGPAKGGAGAYFTEILDVNDLSDLDVKIKKWDSNTETKLLFKLIGVDGKSYTWDIPLADLPVSEFATVKLKLADARGKMSLEEIKQMQIQGSFNPQAKVDVELESIIATGTAPAK